MWKCLKSEQDASVNFVKPMPDGGMLEARFVRREESYFIVYVSSHTGCKHACRFCHLTQTGQTSFTPATSDELIEQAEQVFAYYEEFEPKASHVNINFMARGDAMSSPVIAQEFDKFATYVRDRAEGLGVTYRFNISTIFPTDSVDVDLVEAFGDWPVFFYWSLYSLEPKFRRRWLPRAQSPIEVVERLREYQEATGREVIYHWAFIQDENDDVAQVRDLCAWIEDAGLYARFNLVRYNPHSGKCGVESDGARLSLVFDLLSSVMGVQGSRIVPRVGFDVAASCGMFVE